MPRSNRPARRRRRDGSRGGSPSLSPEIGRLSNLEVSFAGQSWSVRQVMGNSSGRQYTCPGCQQQVSAAVAHMVVWPSDAMQGMENRRHWHTPCWRAREQRRPGGSWA